MISCRRFSSVGFFGTFKIAFDKVKPLAVIAEVFFKNRISASISTLISHPSVVGGTIETNPEIRPALMAILTPPGLTGESPNPTTLVTMPGHGDSDSDLGPLAVMTEFAIAASPVLLQFGSIGIPAVSLRQVHAHERGALGAHFRSPTRPRKQTTHFSKPTHVGRMNLEPPPLKFFLRLIGSHS